ncbi:MAG: hypothetical protein GC136_03790 [Alphaproteobacteria bacterium]|nr:hypothetical protein [Alphaproteobacteria bacterium]
MAEILKWGKRVLVGAFAASILVPEAVDPFADELFGICRADIPLNSNDINAARLTPANLDSVFATIPAETEFIGILDTDHSNGDIRLLAYSDEMIERYVAQNVRRIFIENDRDNQEYIDSFLNGELSDDEFYSYVDLSVWINDSVQGRIQHDYIAAQIKKMHEAGIRIYAIDSSDRMPPLESIMAGFYVLGAMDQVEDECGSQQVTRRMADYWAISRTWQTLLTAAAIQRVGDGRLNERALGEKMLDIARNEGGRSAIFYGWAHFSDWGHGFVSSIGRDNIYTIALRGSNGISEHIEAGDNRILTDAVTVSLRGPNLINGEQSIIPVDSIVNVETQEAWTVAPRAP